MADRLINVRRIPVAPDALTPEQIEQICCDPNIGVDPCSEVGQVSPWNGFSINELDIAIGPQDDNWTGIIRYRGIGPDGPCGELRESWEGRLNCCEDVTPIVFDLNLTVSAVSPASGGQLVASGGSPPYTWTVTGEGFYLNRARTLKQITSNFPQASLFTNELACGTALIRVTDGCTEPTVRVTSTTGQFVLQPIGTDPGVKFRPSPCPPLAPPLVPQCQTGWIISTVNRGIFVTQRICSIVTGGSGQGSTPEEARENAPTVESLVEQADSLLIEPLVVMVDVPYFVENCFTPPSDTFELEGIYWLEDIDFIVSPIIPLYETRRQVIYFKAVDTEGARAQVEFFEC